jgi:hypothetical protein
VKIETVHVGDIEWSKPEWADPESQALTVITAGYELEIGPSVEQKGKWDWACRMTSQISESPELVNAGTASSASGAKRGAGTAANRDQRRRAKAKLVTENVSEAHFDEPEPDPGPTAGEMLDAVESQVNQATKPKRTRRQKTPAAV